ncbi:MAG: fimbrial biogenesis outer membrane usher protein [Gammaproteobacteria bacterium]|nr:fimbrial biogenesis outer membrane usher protein [Gammaproteobacteria bacterium]
MRRDRTYSGFAPRRLPAIVLLLLCAALVRSLAFAAGESLHEAVLEIALAHGGPSFTAIVLRGAGDTLYLSEADFARLRLKRPKAAPIVRAGQRYFDPAALPGCRVRIDEARQRAVIDAPGSAFLETRVDVHRLHGPPITPAALGAFLNYQLYGQQITGQLSGGAYGELGVFSRQGVITNSFTERDTGTQRSFVRLDSTYQRDFPDALETLDVGDAITDVATWGDAVRYGGLRFSRNFSLRPDLLTTPLLTTSGTATVPSTVDVFVNNQLVTSTQVPAGPFVINRLPTISGAGDVNVVVRDALGREQVLTQQFYSSTSLLASGLDRFSFNLGAVREDYGLSSQHYGPMVAEGTYGRGLTNWLTLDGHAEAQRGGPHAAGLDAAIGVGDWGLVTVNLVDGGDPSGSGWLRGIGFEHRGPRLSLVLDNNWYAANFAQVGQSVDPTFRLRERTVAQGGLVLWRGNAISLAYVRQAYRAQPAQQTVSLTQSIGLGHYGALNLTVTRLLGSSPSTSAYLTFVMPLGHRSAATANAVGGSGPGAPQNEFIASYTESPPVGPGNGYRLSLSSAGNYDADWQRQFEQAGIEFEAARNAGISGRNAYLNGSLTLLDGQVHATRQINGSFAAVDLDGLPNVPVYVENQLTTRTDASGKAILYNLRPYEANRISVDPADLPLDTQIDAASETVAPPYRSGIVVRFPVERVRGATFHLVRDDGKPVPVGAIVDFKGETFPVVLDGLVYVTGYDHGLGADAHWPGGACRFRVPPPVDDRPLPDLGRIECYDLASGAGR